MCWPPALGSGAPLLCFPNTGSSVSLSLSLSLSLYIYIYIYIYILFFTLEKEMATHSSTLAWKIPWTEKPGRPQSMGSQSDMTEQLHFLKQVKLSSRLVDRTPSTGLIEPKFSQYF